MPYNPYVYCLNPKMIANYRKSFIDLPKTDPLGAFVIADFARVGHINIEPRHGSQYLALQSLIKHRLHLVKCITRGKTYMISNIFLKFSELSILKDEAHPFTNNHTTTASAILTELLSLEDVVSMPIEELADFVCKTSKNQVANPAKVADILRQATRTPYRFGKCLYEPLTISIASSFNCVSVYQKEIKIIDKSLEKISKGLIL